MSKLAFNAYMLRILLILSLVVGIGAGVAGFLYGQELLKKIAVDISHKEKDAEASSLTLSTLQDTEGKLKQYDTVRQNIGAIYAEDQFPEFRVVDEVRAVASHNNIKVTSFSYTNSIGTQAAATKPQGLSTGKVKTIPLFVNLESSIDTKSFLQFIYDIEQHLPMMRIAGVSLAPSTSGDKINVSQLTVELYIK